MVNIYRVIAEIQKRFSAYTDEGNAITDAIAPIEPGKGYRLIRGEQAMEMALAPHPMGKLYREYLESLDDHTLHVLLCLYYSGRHDGEEIYSYKFFSEDQGPREREECIDVLLGKPRVHECISKGVLRARRDGLDLENI